MAKSPVFIGKGRVSAMSPKPDLTPVVTPAGCHAEEAQQGWKGMARGCLSSMLPSRTMYFGQKNIVLKGAFTP